MTSQFFLYVPSPNATQPNGAVSLINPGAVSRSASWPSASVSCDGHK